MQMQDLNPGADTEKATLAWLVEALEYARSRGQTRVVGYLEEVADDVVFEVEMAARRASLVGQQWSKRPTLRQEGVGDVAALA